MRRNWVGRRWEWELSRRSDRLGAEFGDLVRAWIRSAARIFGFGISGTGSLSRVAQGRAAVVGISAGLVCGLCNYSFAFEMPGTINSMTPRRPGAVEKPSRDYTGLPLGGWMLYPTLFAGVVYDDNVNPNQLNRSSGVGLRLVPRLVAVRNTGIHNSTLYGSVDARLTGGGGGEESVAARAGVTHEYEAMRDLIFRFQGDYTRQTDVFNSASSFNSASNFTNTSIVQNPFANTNLATSSPYNQFTGAATVTKTMNRSFVVLGGSISHIAYDNTASLVGGALVPSSLDGTVYVLSGRVGYWVTPLFYSFAESSIDRRNFATSAFDSSVYRFVGGIGIDQIGLVRGEVFAGYQSSHQDFATLQSAGGGVFGGRLAYYPTRYWTLRASLDETLGLSTVASPTSPLGTSTRVTTALLQSDYAISKVWTAGVRFGYTETQYSGSLRQDRGWLAGGSFNYNLWRNLGLTIDYQMTKLDSNVPLQSFTRNVVTVGATYRY